MSKPHKRRVAITGMGAVTPLGNTMNSTWNGIIEGRNVAAPTKKFDGSQFPTKFAYEVANFELDRSLIPNLDTELLNLAAQYGINAATEAVSQAGVTASATGINRDRIAVCLGVGMFSPDFPWFEDVMLTEKYDEPHMAGYAKYWPNTLTSVIARAIGARGGTTTVHTACASSGQSLGEAYELIAYGDADIVVTGGADSMINPFHTAGFCLLGALSKRNDAPNKASRPFDEDRDGFVLGEGACMLVFEEYEHAKARGAKILGEVVGYGVTESAYRITDLHPEGMGPKEAMEMAIEDAGVSPPKVGYLNAHGTSTHLNDKCESLAVSKVFPAGDCDLHVSSTKSMTGHLISAAGAIEAAVCVLALDHQVLPPSINLENQDPQVSVKVTGPTPEDKDMEYALSNSVGFGGSNTAIVVRRAI